MGYLYHATSDTNAHDIAHDGQLKTHKPWHGTDQDAWPDGSTEKRAYFTRNESRAAAFHPDNGRPVLLRIDDSKAPGAREERYTKDVYVTKPVPAAGFEVKLSDGTWQPLLEWAQPQAASRTAAADRVDTVIDEIARGDIALKQQLESAAQALYAEDYTDDEVIANLRGRRKLDRAVNIPGAKWVGDSGEYKIYNVTTFGAAAALGSNSWCIVRDEKFWNSYTGKGIDFYFYISKTRGAPADYAVAAHESGRTETYDKNDQMLPFFEESTEAFDKAPERTKHVNTLQKEIATTTDVDAAAKLILQRSNEYDIRKLELLPAVFKNPLAKEILVHAYDLAPLEREAIVDTLGKLAHQFPLAKALTIWPAEVESMTATADPFLFKVNLDGGRFVHAKIKMTDRYAFAGLSLVGPTSSAFYQSDREHQTNDFVSLARALFEEHEDLLQAHVDALAYKMADEAVDFKTIVEAEMPSLEARYTIEGKPGVWQIDPTYFRGFTTDSTRSNLNATFKMTGDQGNGWLPTVAMFSEGISSGRINAVSRLNVREFQAGNDRYEEDAKIKYLRIKDLPSYGIKRLETHGREDADELLKQDAMRRYAVLASRAIVALGVAASAPTKTAAQPSRSIVVAIPENRRAEVVAEEADVARRLAAGEQGITYYWQMGQLPKEQPARVYFAWDGKVRAYHDVVGMERSPKGRGGRVILAPQIHEMPEAEQQPMPGFRGFRYFTAAIKHPPREPKVYINKLAPRPLKAYDEARERMAALLLPLPDDVKWDSGLRNINPYVLNKSPVKELIRRLESISQFSSTKDYGYFINSAVDWAQVILADDELKAVEASANDVDLERVQKTIQDWNAYNQQEPLDASFLTAIEDWKRQALGLRSVIEDIASKLSAMTKVRNDERRPEHEDVEVLYHASINAKQLATNGFAAAIPEAGGIGGSQSTRDYDTKGTSFTSDLYVAKEIARSLREVIAIANGETTYDTVLRWSAEAGLDPAAIDKLARDTFIYGNFRPIPKEHQEPGYFPKTTGKPHRDDPRTVFGLYKAYLAMAAQSSKRYDPLYFNVSIDNFKGKDPSDVGVVSAQVDMTNKKISYHGAMHEWRVPPEAILGVVGFIGERPGRAAAPKTAAFGNKNYWVDPDGQSHETARTHDAWALENRGKTANNLLDEGWVRVAPPDAVQARALTPKVAATVRSIITSLLRDYPDRAGVWVETDEDNTFVPRTPTGRPDFSVLLRTAKNQSDRLPYIGQCDTIRRSNPAGENFWQEMMQNAQSTSADKFERSVDASALLDEGETLAAWLGSDAELFESSVQGEPVYFIKAGGFEFIFAKSAPPCVRTADQLPGGAADDVPESDFNPAALEKGTKHELEHTDDEALAGEIARDHLVEDPQYYEKLKKVEAAGPILKDPEPVTRGLLPYLKNRKFDSARDWRSIQTALNASGWAALLQRVGSTPQAFAEAEEAGSNEFYDICAKIDSAITADESHKIEEFLHRYDPMAAPSWAFQAKFDADWEAEFSAPRTATTSLAAKIRASADDVLRIYQDLVGRLRSAGAKRVMTPRGASLRASVNGETRMVVIDPEVVVTWQMAKYSLDRAQALNELSNYVQEDLRSFVNAFEASKPERDQREKAESEDAKLDQEGKHVDGKLPKRGPVWMYHATSTALLPSIEERGLLADPPKRTHAEGLGSTEQSAVYLHATGSGPEFDGYLRRAVAEHGGRPVVLRVLVNAEDLEKDPDDADIASGRRQFIYRGDIAPSQIRAVDGQWRTAAASGFKAGDGAADIEALTALANESPTFDDFRSKVQQKHLVDLSNPEGHRFGRAFPTWASEDEEVSIADMLETGQYLEDVKYSNPVEHHQITRNVPWVWIYRAVPARFARQGIRVGDYVALDPAYARMHGRSVLRGEQKEAWKTVKARVPKTDVIWGQADFTEWAYSPKTLRDRVKTLEDFYKEVTGRDTKSVPSQATKPAAYVPDTSLSVWQQFEEAPEGSQATARFYGREETFTKQPDGRWQSDLVEHRPEPIALDDLLRLPGRQLKTAALVDIPPKMREQARAFVAEAHRRINARAALQMKTALESWYANLPHYIASVQNEIDDLPGNVEKITKAAQLEGLRPDEANTFQIYIPPMGAASESMHHEIWCQQTRPTPVYRYSRVLGSADGAPYESAEEVIAAAREDLDRALEWFERRNASGIDADDGYARAKGLAEYFGAKPEDAEVTGGEYEVLPIDLEGWRYNTVDAAAAVKEKAPNGYLLKVSEIEEFVGEQSASGYFDAFHNGPKGPMPLLFVQATPASYGHAAQKSLRVALSTLDHELTHFAQILLKWTKGLDTLGGLPGGVTENAYGAGLPHEKRPVEFYPNIVTELGAFEEHMRNSAGDRDFEARRWVRGQRFFELRRHDEQRWKKFVTEFLRAVSNSPSKTAKTLRPSQAQKRMGAGRVKRAAGEVVERKIDELAAGDVTKRQQLETLAAYLYSLDYEDEEVAAELAKRQTPAQRKVRPTVPGADLVGEVNGFDVYHIKTFQASQALGTKNWCIVRDQQHWDNYTGNDTSFFFYVPPQGAPAWYAVAVHESGMTETYDFNDDLCPVFAHDLHTTRAPLSEEAKTYALAARVMKQLIRTQDASWVARRLTKIGGPRAAKDFEVLKDALAAEGYDNPTYAVTMVNTDELLPAAMSRPDFATVVDEVLSYNPGWFDRRIELLRSMKNAYPDAFFYLFPFEDEDLKLVDVDVFDSDAGINGSGELYVNLSAIAHLSRASVPINYRSDFDIVRDGDDPVAQFHDFAMDLGDRFEHNRDAYQWLLWAGVADKLEKTAQEDADSWIKKNPDQLPDQLPDHEDPTYLYMVRVFTTDSRRSKVLYDEMADKAQAIDNAKHFIVSEGRDSTIPWSAVENVIVYQYTEGGDEVVVWNADRDYWSKKEAKSASAEAPGSDLVAVHNLSTANLLHAAKVGGLIAPSIAITKVSQTFDNFGDITLIAPAEMVNPKNTPVFDADIYSPRYPKTYYKPKYKEISKFREEIGPYAARTNSHFGDAEHTIEYKGGVEELLHSRRSLPALQLAFLEQVKGLTVEDVKRLRKPKYPFSTAPSMAAYWQAHPYNVNSSEVPDAHTEAMRKAIEEHYAADPTLSDEDRKAVIEWTTEQYAKGHLTMYDSTHKDFQEAGKEEIDQDAFADKLKDLIAPHQQEFETWAKKRLESLQGTPYIVGDRGGKIKYTPENVLKQMTKKTQGGESFNYGVGTARAMGAHRFWSFQDMINRADGLVSKDDFEKIKSEVNDRYFELLDKVRPYHKASDSFRFADTLISSIGQSYKPRTTLRRELTKDGFSRIPSHIYAEIEKFREDLPNLPTQYFEAKPQRIILLDEFVGAAAPSDAGPEVFKVLKNAGLKVETYDKETPGSRAAACQKLLALLPAASFSAVAKSAAQRRFAMSDIVYHGSNNSDLAESSLQAGEPSYEGGIGYGVYVAFDRDVAEFFGRTVYKLRLKLAQSEIFWLTPDTIDTGISEYIHGSILPDEHVAPFSFDLKGQRYSVVTGSGGATDDWYIDLIARSILSSSEWGDAVTDFSDATDDVFEVLAEEQGVDTSTMDATVEQALLQQAQAIAAQLAQAEAEARAQAERELGLCISLDEVGNEVAHAGYKAVYLEGVRGNMPDTELLVFNAEDLEMLGIDEATTEEAAAPPNVRTAGAVVGYLRDGDIAGRAPGVFLRIPEPLAAQFPQTRGDDESPPHFTLAYVLGRRTSDSDKTIVRGKPNDDRPDLPPLNDQDRHDMVAAVSAALSGANSFAPFELQLAKGVEWFENGKGKQIAHKEPEKGSEGAAKLEQLATRIREALGAEGFVVSFADKPFLAHSTLAYLPTREYTGAVPEGSFTVDHVELWGWPETWIFDLEGASQQSRAASPTRLKPRTEYDHVCPHCDEIIYEKHVVALPPDYKSMKHRDCGGIIEWSKEARAYHGTPGGFRVFEHDRSGLGTHFGTELAAEQRGQDLSRIKNFDSWEVREYELSVSNPLRLPDVIAWDHPHDVAEALANAGVISRDDVRRYEEYGSPPEVAQMWAELRAKVEAAGYDAVVYLNNEEDAGHDSWIVWDNSKLQWVDVPGEAPSAPSSSSTASKAAAGLIDVNALVKEIAEPLHESIYQAAKPLRDAENILVNGVDFAKLGEEVARRFAELTRQEAYAAQSNTYDFGELWRFEGARGILKKPEAQKRFERIKIVLDNSGGNSYFEYGRRPKIVFKIAPYLLAQIRAPYTRDWKQSLTEVVSHEIRHAADWAYQDTASPGQFDLKNPNDEAYSQLKSVYYNTPTEILSYAGNAAERLWAMLGVAWTTMSGKEIVEWLKLTNDKPYEKMTEENRKKYLQLIVNGLRKLHEQHGRETWNDFDDVEASKNSKADDAKELVAALGREIGAAIRTAVMPADQPSSNQSTAPTLVLWAVIVDDRLLRAVETPDVAKLQATAVAADPDAEWSVVRLDNVPADTARKLLSVHSPTPSIDPARAATDAKQFITEIVAESAEPEGTNRRVARSPRSRSRNKKREENRKRLYMRTWYLREGSNIAWDASYGMDDAVEIMLRPDARVLDLTRGKRTAAAAPTDELNEIRLKMQALESLVSKLTDAFSARPESEDEAEEEYDVVVLPDRLLILNPDAIEKMPSKKGWSDA